MEERVGIVLTPAARPLYKKSLLFYTKIAQNAVLYNTQIENSMFSRILTRSCPLLFLLVFFALPRTVALAQSRADYAPCSYYGEGLETEIRMYPASEHAKKVISGVISVLGLKPNFEVREANVPNAAAVILDSKRYILYNGEFMDAISTASGTYWAGISILAHEIGHHLNGHTLDAGGSRPSTELESDEFSGFVLCKMGASLNEAQAAMAVAASLKASHTHPAKRDRLHAIANGWNTASGQRPIASRTAAPGNSVEKPVITRRKAEDPILAEKHIAFDVHFAADSNGIYYITTKGHLVNVDRQSTYLIGSLSESNKRGYRLMLSDKNYNYLYIAEGGSIENGMGKKVGTIRPHED